MRLSRMISVTLLGILGHWFFAGAVQAISEENYKQEDDEKVWPFFLSQGTEGTITTEDQVKLAYKTVIHQDLIATLVDTVIGGATWSWLKASLKATWTMRDQADRQPVPMLMLQAGKDNIVRTGGQDKVCADATLCLKVVFPLAMHAILAEYDRIRTKAMREIMDFIRYRYQGHRACPLHSLIIE